jgi:hypothetical protein
MAIKKLSLTRGDSQRYTLTFRQSNGTLYCLKNWVVFFTLKTDYSLPDSQASLQKIITTFSDTTSGTSGVAEIVLLPTDTVNLEPRQYDFDISVRTAANETFTVLKGTFDLEYDVTRSAGTAGTAP